MAKHIGAHWTVYARRRWEPLKYLPPDMVRVSCKADISVAPHINTSKRTVSRALPSAPRPCTEFRFLSWPRVTPDRHPSFESPIFFPSPSPLSILSQFLETLNNCVITGRGREGWIREGGEVGWSNIGRGMLTGDDILRLTVERVEHWTLASSDRRCVWCVRSIASLYYTRNVVYLKKERKRRRRRGKGKVEILNLTRGI